MLALSRYIDAGATHLHVLMLHKPDAQVDFERVTVGLMVNGVVVEFIGTLVSYE